MTLSNFFVQSLFPLIQSRLDSTFTSKLQDGIIDIIWQLDQELDSGLLSLLNTEATPTSITPEQARLKLAEFVKLLISGEILSKQDCKERLETLFLALPPLDLISNQPAFNRLEVRARTAL